MHGLSKMAEALFYLFSIESPVIEECKVEYGNFLERLDMLDVLD